MVDLLQQHRSGTSGFSGSAGPGWSHSRITTRKSRVAFINLSSTCQHGRHTRAQPGEPLWQHTAITLSTWLWYPGPQLPSTSGGELQAAPLQLSAQLSQKTLTFRGFFFNRKRSNFKWSKSCKSHVLPSHTRQSVCVTLWQTPLECPVFSNLHYWLIVLKTVAAA